MYSESASLVHSYINFVCYLENDLLTLPLREGYCKWFVDPPPLGWFGKMSVCV